MREKRLAQLRREYEELTNLPKKHYDSAFTEWLAKNDDIITVLWHWHDSTNGEHHNYWYQTILTEKEVWELWENQDEYWSDMLAKYDVCPGEETESPDVLLEAGTI